MRNFFFLITVFFQIQAFSQRTPDPIPGLQAALRFCNLIQSDDIIIKCIALESGANWVTREALPVCENQNFDNERVSCLEGIINSDIRPQEARICESLNFPSEQAKCLREIRRPFPYVTRIKVDPQPGLDAAATFCQSFFFDNDKKKCLNEMVQADLITTAVVEFCSRQFTDQNKIICLGRLKNRFVIDDEVLLCQKVFTDERQIKCLEGVQRKYKKIPR